MKRISILAASMLLAASAQAALTFSNPLELTEIGQTGSLDLFDSNLGTLTGAVLTVNGEAVFSYGANNKAATTVNANLTSSTSLLWTSTLAPVNALISAGSLDLSATSGIQSYAAGASRSFGPTSDSDSTMFDLSGILASLQAAGGGSFGIGCSSLSGLTVQGGGGNLNTNQETRAGCGASIAYTFTPTPTQVPEPTSLALVGLALAAAGFTASRRKA